MKDPYILKFPQMLLYFYQLTLLYSQCYGIVHSIGHVDIWVNGGKHQPACEEEGDGHRVLESK